MPTRNLSFFESERTTLQEAMQYTLDSLLLYFARFRHIIICFSGGKDSTTVLTLILYFLKLGLLPRPDTLTVLLADTRLELPPLMAAARRLLAQAEQLGIETRIVEPLLRQPPPTYTERFYVYMFGVGVPPPNSQKLRWCTRKMKADPMHRVRTEMFQRHGAQMLSLTGVRRGESVVRDGRIALSCSKDGGECGQGWFQNDADGAVGSTLAPIDTWRLCHVEQWLMIDAPAAGFDTAEICTIYGYLEDDETSAGIVGLRTGCMKCPLVTEDRTLAYLMSKPEYAYLTPLNRLDALWEELRAPGNRLRKNGERNKSGLLSANPNRMGPLTMEARRYGLETVLDIQRAINTAAAEQGRPPIVLIDTEEAVYIRELCAMNVYPRRWDGSEQRADVLTGYVVGEGVDQPLLEGW